MRFGCFGDLVVFGRLMIYTLTVYVQYILYKMHMCPLKLLNYNKRVSINTCIILPPAPALLPLFSPSDWSP